jgi:DNA-binding CsgD family transcriptional regulator
MFALDAECPTKMDDRSAIMAVLKAETDAWMRRDFASLAQHWVQGPETRRMTAFASLGTHVDLGWEAIWPRLKRAMELSPQTFETSTRLSWGNVNIVVGQDMAWVTYDQVGQKCDDDFELAGVQHELKIFHRVDGVWKIACLAILQSSIEHAVCPLIEVDAEARVIWLNAPARASLVQHHGLIISNDRLRARHPEHDTDLRQAIRQAFARREDIIPQATAKRQARAIALGEGEDLVPQFCWVVIEDGKVLVSFDDNVQIDRKICSAALIYGLSPTQARLARLLADGLDLGQAAQALRVSVTTARTHLQRMFDRTGQRSQSALIRALLTTEVPGK